MGTSIQYTRALIDLYEIDIMQRCNVISIDNSHPLHSMSIIFVVLLGSSVATFSKLYARSVKNDHGQ